MLKALLTSLKHKLWSLDLGNTPERISVKLTPILEAWGKQYSHILPRMKFPTFSWLNGPHSLPILHEIMWNLFTYREYFKILDTRGHGFLKIWFSVWSNIPLFVFELSYIFHSLKNMKFPTFSWLFDPFPNLSWLCQSIPHIFKALQNLNLIPDFFKIFQTNQNPGGNLKYVCNETIFTC